MRKYLNVETRRHIWNPASEARVARFRVTSAFAAVGAVAAAQRPSTPFPATAPQQGALLVLYIQIRSYHSTMFRATLLVLVLCVLSAIAFTPSASSRTSSRPVINLFRSEHVVK